jgi:hypothetical protein
MPTPTLAEFDAGIAADKPKSGIGEEHS